MPVTDFSFVNPNLREEWQSGTIPFGFFAAPVEIPAGVVKRIEDGKVLEEYKKGKEMACADIVLCTRKPSGAWAVLYSLRKSTEPFGGQWWMYGGSVGAYVNVLEFIVERAERECGIPVRPEALLGFYRTSASDKPQSTTQPCFAARVPYEVVEQKMRADPNHESVRLFEAGELDDISHWYPYQAAKLVFANVPQD